jgi:hypothetical protein
MEPAVTYKVLQTLEDTKVKFRLSRDRPDTMRADATLYGLRLEVECFDANHVEASRFRRTEDVDGRYDYLQKILSQNIME